MDEPKFVFAKNNITISELVSVGKDDVGKIESESMMDASIFFIRIWQRVDLNKNGFEVFDVEKVGDAFPKKICNICHKLLPVTQFDRNQNGVNNRPVRRPSCRTCRKILDGMKLKPNLR